MLLLAFIVIIVILGAIEFYKHAKRFPVIDPIVLTSKDGWTLTIPATTRFIHIKAPDGELSLGYTWDPKYLLYKLGNEELYFSLNAIIWDKDADIKMFPVHPATKKQLQRHFSNRKTLP